MDTKSKSHRWLIVIGLLMIVSAIILQYCTNKFGDKPVQDVIISGPR